MIINKCPIAERRVDLHAAVGQGSPMDQKLGGTPDVLTK